MNLGRFRTISCCWYKTCTSKFFFQLEGNSCLPVSQSCSSKYIFSNIVRKNFPCFLFYYKTLFNIRWTKCNFSFQKQSKKYTTTSDIGFFFSFCFHCRFCSNSVNSNVFSFYMFNLYSGKFMMGLNASNNIVIGFNNFLPLLKKKAPKCDGAPTISDNSAASIPSSFFV